MLAKTVPGKCAESAMPTGESYANALAKPAAYRVRMIALPVAYRARDFFN